MPPAAGALRLLGSLLAACLCRVHAACPACAPKSRTPVDVVVPFREEEVCKLKISVKSWMRHDPMHVLGNIYFIWTSLREQLVDYIDDMNEMRKVVESNNKKLYILDASQQMKRTNMKRWFLQQVVKLKVAAQVNADFYLVLDARNAFVVDIKPSTFLTKCNQAAVYADYTWARAPALPKPEDVWYRNAAALFNVSPAAASRWPAPMPPLVMHKPTVLDMLTALGEGLSSLCDGDLCARFGQTEESKRITEFTTYLTYALTRKNASCTYGYVRGSATKWYGGTGGGVLNFWRSPEVSRTGEHRLNAAQNAATGLWNVTVFGFQHASLDNVPFHTRSRTAFAAAKVYRRAGLYHFASLDNFTKCIVGTNLLLKESEALVSSPWGNKSNSCKPRWICSTSGGAAPEAPAAQKEPHKSGSNHVAALIGVAKLVTAPDEHSSFESFAAARDGNALRAAATLVGITVVTAASAAALLALGACAGCRRRRASGDFSIAFAEVEALLQANRP